MILAVPYFKEAADYDALSKAIQKRGNLKRHSLLVITRACDEADAMTFAQTLADLAGRVAYEVIDSEGLTNSALSALMFSKAVRFVAGYQPVPGEPPAPGLLYLDPNYRPVANGWLDHIQAEYHIQEKPVVMGAATTEDDGGRVVHGPVVVSGEFVNKTTLLGYVPPGVSWRNYLRNEVASFLVEADFSADLKPAPPGKK